MNLYTKKKVESIFHSVPFETKRLVLKNVLVRRGRITLLLEKFPGIDFFLSF